jgi:hypothetical protein
VLAQNSLDLTRTRTHGRARPTVSRLHRRSLITTLADPCGIQTTDLSKPTECSARSRPEPLQDFCFLSFSARSTAAGAVTSKEQNHGRLRELLDDGSERDDSVQGTP